MGTLSSGSWSVEFEDRLLTHLQIVIVQRFRRAEPILVSWLQAASAGSGRWSIWLTPTTPVVFEFAGSRVPVLDEEWLKRLHESAASATGLVVTDEHGTPVRLAATRRTRFA